MFISSFVLDENQKLKNREKAPRRGRDTNLKPLPDTLYLYDKTAGIFLGNDRIGDLAIVPNCFRTFRYFIRYATETA